MYSLSADVVYSMLTQCLLKTFLSRTRQWGNQACGPCLNSTNILSYTRANAVKRKYLFILLSLLADKVAASSSLINCFLSAT